MAPSPPEARPGQPGSSPAARYFPAARLGLGQPDPHGAEQPRRPLQHHQPRVGHGQESLHGDVEVRPEPGVRAQRGHRPLVAAEHQRVKLAAEAAEDGDRVIRGGLQRLARLLLPPPGNRCCDVPPAALRPWTSLLPTFEATSCGVPPVNTPAA